MIKNIAVGISCLLLSNMMDAQSYQRFPAYQAPQFYNYEIGINPLRYDYLPHQLVSRNDAWIPMLGVFVHKMNPQSAWSDVYSFSIGINSIDDNCDCNDQLYGIGKYRDVQLQYAKRWTMGAQKGWWIQPFVQPGLSMMYYSYKGDFKGGYFGGGANINRQMLSLDFDARIGLQVLITPRVTFQSSMGWNIVYGYKISEKNYQYQFTYRLNVLQVGLGYCFKY